jgi:hypothetical protein
LRHLVIATNNSSLWIWFSSSLKHILGHICVPVLYVKSSFCEPNLESSSLAMYM